MNEPQTTGFFRVLALPPEKIVDLLEMRARNFDSTWLVTLNWEMMSQSLRRDSYRDLLDGADFFCADGASIVLLSQIARNPVPCRASGVDLVRALLFSAPDLKTAVIGGSDANGIKRYFSSIGHELAWVWTDNYDGSDEQNGAILKTLVEMKVQVAYVGMGIPKQDQICSYLRRHRFPGVCIGIGGTFDLLSERLSRAPMWMQKYGLEWLFRLYQEPRRLWKRYLVHYPIGIALYLVFIVKRMFQGKK